MNRIFIFSICGLLLWSLGCAKENAPPVDKDAKIREALAQLSPEDRKLAEEQSFCAIQKENRLGSMGKPVKLTIKDQPVFLCCDGCTKKAEADPDKTLATVAELKTAHRKSAGK